MQLGKIQHANCPLQNSSLFVEYERCWDQLHVLESLGELPLRVIPAGDPDYRPATVAPAQDRLAMVEIAANGNPRLIVDGRALSRQGASNTVDTLESLRAEFGPSLFRHSERIAPPLWRPA